MWFSRLFTSLKCEAKHNENHSEVLYFCLPLKNTRIFTTFLFLMGGHGGSPASSQIVTLGALSWSPKSHWLQLQLGADLILPLFLITHFCCLCCASMWDGIVSRSADQSSWRLTQRDNSYSLSSLLWLTAQICACWCWHKIGGRSRAQTGAGWWGLLFQQF